MKKVSLVVHQNYLEDLIKTLHQKGSMEIININKEEPELIDENEKAPVDPESETCALYELRLTRLIDILKRIKPKQKGVISLIAPELPEIKTIEESSLDELYSFAEGYLSKTEKKILEREEKLQSLNERKEKLAQDLEKIKYLTDFDFKFSDLGESEYLIVKVGITKDLDFINKEIKKIKSATLFSKQFGTKKKIEWAVLIVAHKSYQDEIEKISKVALAEFSFDVSAGTPKEAVSNIKKQIQEIDQNRKKLIAELRVYAKNQLSDLLALREELQLEKVRKEISNNFAKTKSSYIVKGWILEKDEKNFEDFIKNSTNSHVICNFEGPSEEKDAPPTYIKTPRWAGGFKGLVSMFATPKYNEIDPTIIMGIFFVLFFGIMLGDAGYGLMILVLSLVGYFKFAKYSDMIHDWSFMGIWMGLVTTIIGFLTNSFFGDLMPRFIYHNPDAKLYNFDLFGFHIEPLVDPIKDPISILIVALIFGLIHLNIGIVLSIIQAIRQKKFKELITAKLCWVSLQIGGGILIGSFILDFQFSDSIITIALILVIVGIIQLFASVGPIGFFGITGYVGDWLSYARLLALGLATAGMALAFNVVAELLSTMIPSFLGILILMLGVFVILYLLKKINKSIITIWLIITLSLTITFLVFSDFVKASLIGFSISLLLMVIMLVVLHVINVILQALGAGIHSLRLQYVEFFNRFYEGGGHEFSPFKIQRKYTKLREEK